MPLITQSLSFKYGTDQGLTSRYKLSHQGLSLPARGQGNLEPIQQRAMPATLALKIVQHGRLAAVNRSSLD
ncbi:hypothetical protein N8837_02815 [Pseudomonadales bacterium]|nr:hypothetical protein [Pseudomonadales bacterium]